MYRELILGCQANDEYYQELLVKKFSDSLLSVSYRYSLDWPEAQDNLQEAYITIFYEIHKFKLDQGSFEGWLKRIVARTAMKKFKLKRTKNEIHFADNVPDMVVLPDVYDKMAVDEIFKLVNELPDGFREIFNLYVVESFSFQEISDMLNITPSSVRSRLSRARKSLLQKVHLLTLNEDGQKR